MQQLRRHGDELLEAQRWQASQAARDAQTLDVLNVLYVLKQMLADGRYDDAKAAVAEYRASRPLPMDGHDYHHEGEI